MSTITKITESTGAESTGADTTGADTTQPSGATAPTGVDPTGMATRTPKEEQLWAALTATPGSTCKELAMAAGIGQSTAAKILAGWAKDGTAAKETAAGTGRQGRAPERWFPADTDATMDAALDAATDAATTDAGSVSKDDAADDPAQRVDDSVPDEDEDVDTPMTAGSPESADELPNAASPAHVAGPASAAVEDTPTDSDTGGTDRRPEPAAATDSGAIGGGGVDDQAAAVASLPGDGGPAGAPAADAAASASRSGTRKRLPSGELRGMVEDFLREHPGESFGPSQIGKVIERSSGAIANALVTMHAVGVVERTQDKPLRYRFASSDAPAS